MKTTNRHAESARSALLEVPEECREAVSRILERQRFLRRLLLEIAEKNNEYAADARNEKILTNKKDSWGNCISVSQECRARAMFYRRAAEALSIPNNT